MQRPHAENYSKFVPSWKIKMPPLVNLTRQRFGRLTVLKRNGISSGGDVFWACICDCSREITVVGTSLRGNRTQSCGCLAKEKTTKRSTKHGHKMGGQTSQVYQSWVNMTQRCTNPNNNTYQHYGGRGITICQRWKNFPNFLEDMGEPPTKDHSIDRIDNNGHYYPYNCRWATKQEQARNRRNNHLATHDGKTQCLSSWSEKVNINIQTLLDRIRRGWSTTKTLMTPIRKQKK